MQAIPNSPSPKPNGAQGNAIKAQSSVGGTSETKWERVERFYKEPGGALIAWLFDEARLRGMPMNEVAAELGVTYGYISQMRNGIRKTEEVSHSFCVGCAKFLGVPPMAVKIVAGVVRMTDFLPPIESQVDAVERAIRHIQNDPIIRQAVPMDLNSLSFDAKKVIALLYTETSTQDVFGLHHLPAIVHWCQRAAIAHDDRTFEAVE